MKYYFYKFFIWIILIFEILWILNFKSPTQEFPEKYINQELTYTGEIQKIIFKHSNRVYFIIDHIYQDKKLIYNGQIRARVENYDFILKSGDQIKFKTKIKTHIGYRNPGVLNYDDYLFRQKIGGVAYINAQEIEVIKVYSSNWMKDYIFQQKNIIREKIKKESSSGILLSLLWGEKKLLISAQYNLFKNFGLSHQLVISGLHLGILSFLLYAFFSFVLKFFSQIYLFYPRPKVIQILTWISLTFYFYICESHISLTRAYVACSFILLFKFLGENISKTHLFSIILSIILLFYPEEIYNPGFWLSVISVFSLIYFYYPIYIFLKLKKKNFENKSKSYQLIVHLIFYFSNLVIINFVLFITIQPIIIYFFSEFQPYGLISNLFMVPLMEFFIMPLSLLGIMIWPIYSQLSLVIWKFLLYLIDKISLILLNLSSIYEIKSYQFLFRPYIWEVFLFYFLLLVLFLKLRRNKKIIIIIFGLLFFGGDYFYYQYKFHYPHQLEVNHLDVGQGDSIFVKFPHKKNVLIDTGGNYYFDVGKNILIPYLKNQRIFEIDLLIITHSDLDHFGGMYGLLDVIPIKEIWWNGYSDYKLEQFLKKFKNRGSKIRVVGSGNEIEKEDVKFKFFHPLKKDKYQKDNNESLVFQIIFENKKFLFTGDIEHEVENHLISKYEFELQSDYMKVPHHGSRTSSSDSFLKVVNPVLASLSAKKNNRFLHPHEQVLENYKREKISLFRTDELGFIRIVFGEEEIKIYDYKNREFRKINYLTPKISQESTFHPSGGVFRE